MSDTFSREVLKVSVGKILQTIGWHSINSNPLEVLTDILTQYLAQISKSTNDYANEFGYVEPNLDHLGLAFRDFHINLAELEEYVTYVDFVKGPNPLPKYPLSKEDNLNFLKPGSKEVVTRPVYIHEHLPPMYPLLEANENENETTIKKEEPDSQTSNENSIQIFKKPADIATGESFKRPRLLLEEEGRPTREISSVMMTTSGFLSPAREGKLPESRTPLANVETIPPINNTTPAVNDTNKKPNKLFKKIDKKKERVGKELFKPLTEEKIKKQTTMKDLVKLKQMKGNNPASINNFLLSNDVKISPVPNSKMNQSTTKINKALAAARLKTEKLNTTIIPIPFKSKTPPPPPQQTTTTTTTANHVDKLFTEPDKKKVNIFKKISNVKNEKLENKIMKIKEEIKEESRESSPDLIIDETAEVTNKIHHISNDITIELIDSTQNVTKSPEKERPTYFYDDSPPGTPSTPKTPEMISQSPPLTKEKRKRKDKSKVKKVQKQSPNRLESDVMDIELERPKTPEVPVMMKQEPLPVVPPTVPFPFLPNFGGPGLIPPPLNNQIFSALPFSPLNLHGFGQNPYMPPVHPNVPLNMMQHPKFEESPPQHKPPVIEKAITTPTNDIIEKQHSPKLEKKNKEHKKEKKDKIKKKNKKDKTKNKAEKKKLKEERKDKEKIKKEKKEKRKEKESRENEISVPKLTLKLGSASPRPETPDSRKLNIKPIIKKEETDNDVVADEKREMSPELAKISALVTGQPKPKSTNNPINMNSKESPLKEETPPAQLTQPIRTSAGPGRPRIHPIKPKPSKPNKRQLPVKDSEGNEVWICPACGRQDDGSPMIGCDDCDAWYHWVCVGIQVPPDANEDWYCRNCIARKQEVLQSDKKRKRKKKEKKEH